jgi:hypothetical protein
MATCSILCQSRLLCMGVDMAGHVKHWANGEVERNAFQEFFLPAVSMCCVCPSSKHGLWCSRILENHLAKSLSSWLCESAITELSKHFLCRQTDRQIDRLTHLEMWSTRRRTRKSIQAAANSMATVYCYVRGS